MRAIGSDLHMDYTAVGPDDAPGRPHGAARQARHDPADRRDAPPGRGVRRGHAARPGAGQGPGAPVEVYELTGAGPRARGSHAAAARGLTRFVGRDAELEQLRQALGRARAAGHGQVVALVGEPGVGKSRLVWEFTHSHRTHGWLILEAGSSPTARRRRYLPVIDLLKGYFQIEDRDEPARDPREGDRASS